MLFILRVYSNLRVQGRKIQPTKFPAKLVEIATKFTWRGTLQNKDMLCSRFDMGRLAINHLSELFSLGAAFLDTNLT